MNSIDAINYFFIALIGSARMIPESIWTGMLTAVVALTVVNVQNKSHRKDLELQLDKDAIEKEKDRKISYRKEVYLNYLAEGTKAFSYLGALPNKDICKENVSSEMSGFMAALAQTSLIVPDETALLLSELNTKFSKFLMEMIIQMGPISTVQSAIDRTYSYINIAQSEQSRVSTERNYMNESGIRDDVRFNGLTATYERHKRWVDELFVERDKLQEQANTLKQACIRKMFGGLIPLGDLQLQIFLKLRSDLGIETDGERLSKYMIEQRDGILQAADETLSAVYSR